MDATTRDLVRQRAGGRCEYCRLHQEHSSLKHHIEHITAKQHGGSDGADNLALACHRCNLHKGTNPTGTTLRLGKWRPSFIRGVIDGPTTLRSKAISTRTTFRRRSHLS